MSMGERGPTGDHGQTGDAGQAGNEGQRGYVGERGSEGRAGAEGRPGRIGETGHDGIAGAQGPPVLTKTQIIVMFLFIVLAFAAVAYRTEVVLDETIAQNNDIKRVLAVTRNAAVEHQDSAKELIDCNTPGRKCNEQQERQVQGYLASIADTDRRTIIAAFICNDRSGGQQLRKLTVCIDDLLKRK